MAESATARRRLDRPRKAATTKPKTARRVPLLRLLRQMDAEEAKGAVEPAFTFIDLFAGIGGMRLGFESVGGTCVFTCERDPYCQKTYAANFPNDDHEIAGDIRDVAPSDIPITMCCLPASRASHFLSREYRRKTP